METTDITRALFNSKREIDYMDGPGTAVGKLGPAGIHSIHYRKPGKAMAAKYSTLAVFLGSLLVKKSIFIAFCHYGAYIEMGSTGDRALCDGKAIKWMGGMPGDSHKLYPWFAFCLMGKEYPETWDACREEFLNAVDMVIEESRAGKPSPENVLLACDSLYYGVAKPAGSIGNEENAFTMEEVEQSFKSGLFAVPAKLSDTGMPVPPYASGAPAPGESAKEAMVAGPDFQAARDGEFILPYGWEPAQEARIPGIRALDRFVPSGQYYRLLGKIHTRLNKCIVRMDLGMDGAKAIADDYVNCFVIGKPGTGKTTMAYALGAALGLPVYTIPCSKNWEEDEFQGKTVVSDDGALKRVPTQFMEAYTNGGLIVLEEINLLDPAVAMGVLGQAVEFPFILMKDGFIPVRRHPMCVVIGTFNVGTNGSRQINEALSSRFKQTYVLDDPDEGGFVDIMKSKGYGEKEAKWVCRAYSNILNYLKSPDVNLEEYAMNVTLRSCIGALEDMEEGAEPHRAVLDSMVGKIAEFDLDTANDIYENVVKMLPEM